MSILEFAAAAVIAVYAMVGSAFLSAAFSHPLRCLIVVAQVWGSVVMMVLMSVGVMALIAVIAATTSNLEAFLLAAVPAYWVLLANIAMFLLLAICRAIAELLLDQEQEGPSSPASPKPPSDS